ncbi:MAG: hypothetical protein JXQ99_02895 [Hyphomicrobiaceae bacterium]
MKKDLNNQSISGAANLAERQARYAEKLRQGEIPDWIADHFCDEYLDEVQADLNLDADAIYDARALTWALHEQLKLETNRAPAKKPREIREELETISAMAFKLRCAASAASDQARKACKVHQSELSPHGEIEGWIGPDPFQEILPSLDAFIAALEQPDLPNGIPGSPLSLKRHALTFLANWFEEHSGRIAKSDLEKLAELFIEPALPDDDETRWRDHIKPILEERKKEH